jgi:hypothetical protein
MQPLPPPTYVLLSPLSAVRLLEKPENRRAGNFVTLPAGLTLAPNGKSTIKGLIDVTCDGANYAIFRIDLEERAELLGENPAF